MEIFLGVIVSTLVQWLKNKYGTSKVGTMAIVIGLALAGALGVSLLNHYGLWDSFWKIIVMAGAFYGFIIKNIEDILKKPEVTIGE